MLSPDQVEGHWGYRLTGWLLAHGAQLLVPGLVVCALLVVAAVAYLWFMTGARVIAAGWVWSRFLDGLPHRGGRGSRREQSPEYAAYMASPAWRRRRARVLRRAGRQCQACGTRPAVDVHHLTYAHLGAERPWELLAVCPACHRRLHGRG